MKVAIAFLFIVAAACTGIFSDRELPSLDARTDVRADGADSEAEADSDIGSDELFPGPDLDIGADEISPEPDLDIGGEEVCAAPLLMCGGECVNPNSDDRHCGGCGSSCSAPTATCCSGSCQNCDDGNTCTGDDRCHTFGCMNEAVADMTPCLEGVCCGGVCIDGGECCVEGPCTAAVCRGTPALCAEFSEADCAAQSGCSWNGADVCTGEPASCSEMTIIICESCGGCAWTDSSCQGTPQPCENFNSWLECASCGCTWGPACLGTHADCSSYGDEVVCSRQRGCFWSDQCDMETHHCI